MRYAAGIKLDAERRLGQYLKSTERAKGARAGGEKDGPRGSYVEQRDDAPTLADLGIPRKLAARGPAPRRPLDVCPIAAATARAD